jgi:hypothetical protein
MVRIFSPRFLRRIASEHRFGVKKYRGVLAWVDTGESVSWARVYRPLRFDEGERAP